MIFLKSALGAGYGNFYDIYVMDSNGLHIVFDYIGQIITF